MRKNFGGLYAAPMGVWVTAFFIAPIAIIFVYSFLAKGIYGGVVPRFSLAAYRFLLTETSSGPPS